MKTENFHEIFDGFKLSMFSVYLQVDADGVNVNEKKSHGRFLTAKYPKHQMGLIRRRLNVEDWIDEQLKLLFDVVSHSSSAVFVPPPSGVITPDAPAPSLRKC